MPAGQVWQFVVESAGLNLPAAHARHKSGPVAPAVLCEPGWQCLQLDWARSSWYLPMVQPVQSPLLAAANLPGGQTSQTWFVPAGRYFPPGHGVQAVTELVSSAVYTLNAGAN